MVVQPHYAAYLNRIEPGWQVLRSLALKGRRLACWEESAHAVERATAYGNAPRHPPRRQPGGIALPPKAARLAGCTT